MNAVSCEKWKIKPTDRLALETLKKLVFCAAYCLHKEMAQLFCYKLRLLWCTCKSVIVEHNGCMCADTTCPRPGAGTLFYPLKKILNYCTGCSKSTVYSQGSSAWPWGVTLLPSRRIPQTLRTWAHPWQSTLAGWWLWPQQMFHKRSENASQRRISARGDHIRSKSAPLLCQTDFGRDHDAEIGVKSCPCPFQCFSPLVQALTIWRTLLSQPTLQTFHIMAHANRTIDNIYVNESMQSNPLLLPTCRRKFLSYDKQLFTCKDPQYQMFVSELSSFQLLFLKLHQARPDTVTGSNSVQQKFHYRYVGTVQPLQPACKGNVHSPSSNSSQLTKKPRSQKLENGDCEVPCVMTPFAAPWLPTSMTWQDQRTEPVSVNAVYWRTAWKWTTLKFLKSVILSWACFGSNDFVVLWRWAS